MTRKLTTHERRLLIERVARELCWYGEAESTKGNHRARAVAVIDALTSDGTTAATLKRGIDRVIEGGLAREGVA